MALMSMTGFGRGHAAAKGIAVDVELGSVNRKQFEARINLPRFASALEPRVLTLLRERISRGQISATIRVDVMRSRERPVRVDLNAAKALLAELRAASKALGLPFDVTTQSLLGVPGLLCVEGEEGTDPDSVWPTMAKALRNALIELTRMRKQEGGNLQGDLEKRIARLSVLRARVATRAPHVLQRYRKELRSRLKSATLPIDINDAALQRDLVLFADRTDLSEELVRLESHIEQFSEMLQLSKPVGRALDFLCQEAFREINTIGSKGNDGPIGSLVVQLKTELEAVREQIQNVE